MNYKNYFKKFKKFIQKNSKADVNKYNDLKKEYDELYVVKSKLKEDLFKLVDKYHKLEKENDHLTQVKNQLKKDNTELGQKYIKLNEDSKKQINRLVRKETYQNIAIQSLLKENEILQNTPDNLITFSNTTFDNLTIVIPYKESQYNRKINLRIVLDYLNHINIKNIIISEEYDNKPSSDWILEEYKNKFSLIKVTSTKSEGLFSRSNLINKGVEESTTSFICIQDCDVVIPKNIYEYSLNLLHSGFDLVYPFNRKVKQIADKQSFLKNYDFKNIFTESEFRPNADGGMQFVNKKSFMKIGGYNTNFKGWGSEDNEFILRVILGNLKFIRLNNPLYHLKHEKDVTTRNNDNFLIKSYNLFNTNDVNALINQNEYLMNTTLKYNEKYNNFQNSYFKFKISIIIPVNNPDKFLLERCIKSIIDQTLGFNSIEIILIDNCSTESISIDLIEKLTNKYGNIRRIILDKKMDFKGIYNIGQKEPSADYVMFLNYKNYLISNACEILYNSMINNKNVDIAFGDNINLVKNKKIKNFSSIISNKKFIDTKTLELNSISDEIQLLNNDILMGTKIFKKSFLIKNNLKLNSSTINQIKFLNSKLLFNAKEIYLIGKPILVYEDYYENIDNTKILSHEIIVNNLNTHVEFLKQYYYLFEEYSPKNTNIPLNLVSSWIENELISAKLKQNEFNNLTANISFLVDKFLKNKLTIKPRNYTYEYLYKYIAEEDYTNAYKVYEVLC